MKYIKLLTSVSILVASVGFATTTLADSTSPMIIGYVSLPQINPNTQFIVYCPGSGNVLEVTPTQLTASKVLSVSSYAGKNCQLRLRGLNNSGNNTTVTLANFKFYQKTLYGVPTLAVENFERTNRGQAGNATGIYVKVFGKLYPIKTVQLANLSQNIGVAFSFQDSKPPAAQN